MDYWNEPIKKKLFTAFWLQGASSTTVWVCVWVNCLKYQEVSLSLFTGVNSDIYRECSSHITGLFKIPSIHKDDCSTSYVSYCTPPVLNINSKHCGLLSIVVPDLWPLNSVRKSECFFLGFPLCVLYVSPAQCTVGNCYSRCKTL